ncbi:hypothetical protein ACFYX6_07430 [Streptomyces bacillaris]|uniref:hypothetical protein n=1 Tax=Streptomyces bacillaris TaxID=68179 RepID=UPI0036CE6CB7
MAKDIAALAALLGPDAVMTVASFDLAAAGGRVARIWAVRRPEKLRPGLRDG